MAELLKLGLDPGKEFDLDHSIQRRKKRLNPRLPNLEAFVPLEVGRLGMAESRGSGCTRKDWAWWCCSLNVLGTRVSVGGCS